MLQRNYKIHLYWQILKIGVYSRLGRMEEEITMDYVGFVTSLNPIIIGILVLVLLAGAYSSWVSH
jgi:hypothetical protein